MEVKRKEKEKYEKSCHDHCRCCACCRRNHRVLCVWSFNSKYISKKEALGIAVADAGVSMTEVTDTDVEFEKEHGIARYEVDFEVGFTEYKYLLDPATGEIIDKRTEID